MTEKECAANKGFSLAAKALFLGTDAVEEMGIVIQKNTAEIKCGRCGGICLVHSFPDGKVDVKIPISCPVYNQ